MNVASLLCASLAVAVSRVVVFIVILSFAFNGTFESIIKSSGDACVVLQVLPGSGM